MGILFVDLNVFITMNDRRMLKSNTFDALQRPTNIIDGARIYKPAYYPTLLPDIPINYIP